MPFKFENAVTVGIIFIFIGFIIIFFGALMNSKETGTKTKIAVGGFIGPFPFGFGNDKSMVWFAIVLSLALFLLFFVFNWRIK